MEREQRTQARTRCYQRAARLNKAKVFRLTVCRSDSPVTGASALGTQNKHVNRIGERLPSQVERTCRTSFDDPKKGEHLRPLYRPASSGLEFVDALGPRMR